MLELADLIDRAFLDLGQPETDGRGEDSPEEIQILASLRVHDRGAPAPLDHKGFFIKRTNTWEKVLPKIFPDVFRLIGGLGQFKISLCKRKPLRREVAQSGDVIRPVFPFERGVRIIPGRFRKSRIQEGSVADPVA